VVASLESEQKLEIIEELAKLLTEDQGDLSYEEVCQVLVEREGLRSTGVGSGIAIPHAKVKGLDQLILAVGLSRQGVDFEAVDGKPVHIFMALAAPVSSTGDHLKALAKIARLCSDPGFRERMLRCNTDQEAYLALIEEDERLPH
jgi:PTS system nitrogen regulatory IIA component